MFNLVLVALFDKARSKTRLPVGAIREGVRVVLKRFKS